MLLRGNLPWRGAAAYTNIIPSNSSDTDKWIEKLISVGILGIKYRGKHQNLMEKIKKC